VPRHRVARIVSFIVAILLSAMTLGAWAHRQGRKVQVRFLATGTLILTSWYWNEDAHLPEWFLPADESAIESLITEYRSEAPPLSREVLTSQSATIPYARCNTRCHRSSTQTVMRAALGAPIALFREGLNSTTWCACRVTTSQIIAGSDSSSAEASAKIQNLSFATLYLDSGTTLPKALHFDVLSNSGNRKITVEILCSDYRNISGLSIPTHIERYRDGNLELAIDVTQASIQN